MATIVARFPSRHEAEFALELLRDAAIRASVFVDAVKARAEFSTSRLLLTLVVGVLGGVQGWSVHGRLV